MLTIVRKYDNKLNRAINLYSLNTKRLEDIEYMRSYIVPVLLQKPFTDNGKPWVTEGRKITGLNYYIE